jgi:hypothetical protein
MSSELYDKIVSERGRFEKIVASIPGFRGYHEKQARRTADRLIRDHVSDQLDQRIRRIASIERDILDGGGLSSMSKTRRAKDKLQVYRDRVATAAPKYDGMFAQVKIDNDDLDRIYAFDEAQLRYLDTIDAALDILAAAVGTEGLNDAIEAVYGAAEEAEQAFLLRDDVILQLNPE